MAITGTKKEQGTFSKTYGLASYNVLGVNLSYKQLKDLGFYVKEEDVDKERDFTGERDGNNTVMLEFACQSNDKAARLRRFNFWLENKKRVSRDDDATAPYQFINDQGRTAWSQDAKKFVTSYDNKYFTGDDDNLNPRPAVVGEEEFMAFMRACMAINWKEGGTLVYNVGKLLQGNVKEIRDDLKTEFLSPVLVATTIKQVKKDGEETKEYESFFNKAFAPGNLYSLVATKGQFDDDVVAAIHTKDKNNKDKVGKRQYINPLEEMILKMTNPKYPCKEIYHLGVVKDYVSQLPVEDTATVAETEPEEENTSTY